MLSVELLGVLVRLLVVLGVCKAQATIGPDLRAVTTGTWAPTAKQALSDAVPSGWASPVLAISWLQLLPGLGVAVAAPESLLLVGVISLSSVSSGLFAVGAACSCGESLK